MRIEIVRNFTKKKRKDFNKIISGIKLHIDFSFYSLAIIQLKGDNLLIQFLFHFTQFFHHNSFAIFVPKLFPSQINVRFSNSNDNLSFTQTVLSKCK